MNATVPLRQGGGGKFAEQASRRRAILASFLLLTPFAASGNPVIFDPISFVSFCVVAFYAFVVESGVVALLLGFRGMEILHVFIGYFFTNALVFLFVFQPILNTERVSVPALECLIVLIDAAMMKFLASLDVMQRDAFSGLSWRAAIMISLGGNALSYFVGCIASRKPWFSEL